VLKPVIGDLVNRIPGGGFEGYFDKDLRSLLGDPVSGAFSRGYCGNGDLDACRNSLWAKLRIAARDLMREQGPNPNLWRADGERTSFLPGVLPNTIRTTNRPTFQQVVEFDTGSGT
jgi:hypothetical protein